jgi:L-ascorbate metabolism protein UlaG (beta-lactamase superfamily)
MIAITYHSHACFTISTGKVKILLDPFITGNPLCKISPSDLKPDVILVSHGHGDHVGDTVEIAKNNNSLVIAPYELIVFLQRQGVNPEKCHPMHIGGSFTFDFGKIKLTNALHGSGFVTDNDTIYTGNPCGYLLNLEDKTIYFAGDTGLFSELQLIGETEKIDVALLPIGDNFTMGIEDAAKAAELLNATVAIPMHYNTFDVIEKNPEDFVKYLEKNNITTKGVVVGFEETFILQ